MGRRVLLTLVVMLGACVTPAEEGVLPLLHDDRSIAVGAPAQLTAGVARPSGAGVVLEGDGYRAELAATGIDIHFQEGGDLRLRTESVMRRSGPAIHLGASQFGAVGDSAVRSREGSSERWRAGSGLLEQSWRFEAMPAGAGALVVRVEASGAGSPQATPGGLAFATATGPVSYSDGVFIDANGAETPVPARWVDGAIELSVPDEVVRSAAYPAVLDPVVSAGRPLIDAARVDYLTHHDELRTTFDGTNYVVMWSHDDATWAVRITPDGELLDIPERRVSTDECFTFSFGQDVATGLYFVDDHYWYFCNARYLRVPSDLSETAWVDLPSTVYASSTDGVSQFLLVFGNGTADGDYDGALLGLDEELGPLFPVVAAPGAQRDASAGWIGTGHMVVWTDSRFSPGSLADIRGSLVSSSGTVDTTDGREIVAGVFDQETTPRLFPGAGTHLLTYVSGTVTRAREAVRLDSTGRVIAGSAVSIGTDDAGRNGGVFTGSSWIVGVANSLYRVPLTGAPTLFPRPTERMYQSDRDAASDGSGAALYVHTELDNASSIIGSAVHAFAELVDDGDVVTRVPLATMADRSHPTSYVTADRGEYLITGEEYDGRFMYPYGRRLDVTGRDVRGFVTGSRLWVPTGDGRFLSVSRPLTSWVVTFLDANGFDVGPSTTIPSSETLSPLSLARGDDGYVLAMSSRTGVELLFIHPDGSLGAIESIAPWSPGGQSNPTVTHADAGYFLSWRESGSSQRLVGIRLDETGTPVDRRALELALGTAAVSSVAPTADGWVVLWQEVHEFGERTLHWAHVPGTGAVGPVQSVTGGLGAEYSGVLAWGGERLLLAYASRSVGRPVAEVRGRVLDEVGTVIGADELLFADDFIESVDGLASVGGDDFLLAYRRIDRFDRQARAWTRRITLGVPHGATCTASSDCPSGHCVDGVCCVTACDEACGACSIAAGGSVDGACTPIGSGTTCRAAASSCDGVEVCSGTSLDCPVDAPAANGTSCADGDACDGAEQCMDGACIDSTPLDCDDGSSCTTDSCDPTLGCRHDGDCPDAGMPDAGRPDAGSPDAGASDSGSSDAGVADPDAPDSDVGVADVGGPRDVGTDPPPAASGCSCRAGSPARGSTAVALLIATLSLALIRRR